MIILAIITYALNLLDLIFTLDLVEKYGIDIEANPIGEYLLNHKFLLYMTKFVLIGFLLFTLLILNSKIGIIICFICYLLLTIYHIIIKIKLK